MTCAENKLEGNIGALGLQQFIFDTEGSQDFIVKWPYGEGVNLRCPVPTVLQVYDVSKGDWVDVISSLATNDNSDSQLAEDVRKVVIRQPEDPSKQMTGIKVLQMSPEDYQAKWLNKLKLDSIDSSQVELRVVYYDELEFANRISTMKAQSETEFNLQIAPNECQENTIIDKRKEEEKSLVVKKFVYVKEP